jgi:hypothetical protein
MHLRAFKALGPVGVEAERVAAAPHDARGDVDVPWGAGLTSAPFADAILHAVIR